MEKNIERFNNLLYFSLFSIYYNSVNLILYLIIYYNPILLSNTLYNIIFSLIPISLFLISIITYLNFIYNSKIIILLLIYVLINILLLLFSNSFIIYNILFLIASFSYFLIYYLIYKDLYRILSFLKILKFYKIFNMLNFSYFIINISRIFSFPITQFWEYKIFILIYSIILFVVMYKNTYILIKKYSTYYIS